MQKKFDLFRIEIEKILLGNATNKDDRGNLNFVFHFRHPFTNPVLGPGKLFVVFDIHKLSGFIVLVKFRADKLD